MIQTVTDQNFHLDLFPFSELVWLWLLCRSKEDEREPSLQGWGRRRPSCGELYTMTGMKSERSQRRPSGRADIQPANLQLVLKLLSDRTPPSSGWTFVFLVATDWSSVLEADPAFVEALLMTSKRSGGAAALILLIGIWLTLHDRLCPSFQVEGDDEIVSLLLLLWDVSAFICSLHLISTGDSYEGATSAFSSDTFLPHILPPFIEKTQKNLHFWGTPDCVRLDLTDAEVSSNSKHDLQLFWVRLCDERKFFLLSWHFIFPQIIVFHWFLFSFKKSCFIIWSQI